MHLILFIAIGSQLLQFVSASSWRAFWYDWGVLGAYPKLSYHSSDFRPPAVNVVLYDEACSQDYVLLTPRGSSVENPGLLILDAKGEPTWIESKWGEVMDMKVQTYQGKDYITFWAGTDDNTHGRGKYYMLNSAYEVVYIISAAGTLDGDLHDFKLTDKGTALLTAYEIIPSDLTSVGKTKDGWIYDGIFQEISMETGELLFQWRASDFYKVSESYDSPTNNIGESEDSAWDYFHINSVDKDFEGNYYISSRYMHTITAIKPDGNIKWVLGGRRSDFVDLSAGEASSFSWQHHASWHPNNIITVFDNGADDQEETAEYSSGRVIQLNLESMTATLTLALENPERRLSLSQGSVQVLEGENDLAVNEDSGRYFVGWGHSAAYSEFTTDGKLICHVRFAPQIFFNFGWVKSYRAFKAKWVGQPKTLPTLGYSDDIIYVSWNGATEVDQWRLEGSDWQATRNYDFKGIDIISKEGFETSFDIPDDFMAYLRVAALDIHGDVLGYTKVITKWGEECDSDISPAVKPSVYRSNGWYLTQVLIICTGMSLSIWIIWHYRYATLHFLYYRMPLAIDRLQAFLAGYKRISFRER